MLCCTYLLWVALAFLTRLSCAFYAVGDYAVSPELLPGLSNVEDPALIPEMFAGHISLGEEDDENAGNYFFWKFHDNAGRTSERAKNTLIFWLNGGPGCSSMDGALMESGPLRVDSYGKVYLNDEGWHTRGDIVFVDQPVGTGFSTVGSNNQYDKDLQDVSQHFLSFLHHYFEVFADDSNKTVILAGESYAGQYIPYFAQAILDHNSNGENNQVNLEALLIGNGYIDPNQQALSYIPFAFQNGLIQKGDPKLSQLLNQQELCQNKLNANHDDVFVIPECDNILSVLLDVTRVTQDSNGNKVDANQQCTNMYDLRLKDSYPSCGMNWPDDLPYVSKFFNTPGVMEALHLDSEKVPSWHECDDQVSKYLTNSNSKASVHLLPSILESGIEIVLFNGDKDIICNNLGVETLISTLSWGGEKGFTDNMQYYDWRYRDDQNDDIVPAGFVKYERNLTFISVYNASHMVPVDNSAVSRGIVDIYFNDVELVQDNGEDILISESFNTGDSQQLDCDGLDKDSERCQASTIQGDDEEDDQGTDTDAVDNGKEDEDDDEGDDDDDDDENDGDEEDKEEDDDDENDDDDDEEEEDNNEHDDNKNDHSGEEDLNHSKISHRISVGIVSMSISAVILIGLYFTFRERFRPKLRAILVDPNSRSLQSKKTVSWASDLEQDPAELTDPTSGSKRKDGYSNIPAQESRGSFELDDF
ncbi:serine-type carboxypeptidase LALA0_S06e07052g [Lachancea lanzarotensis]|uniref:Carboxypeptidase n=1 Tax=Lachancea lanzarotensis TaxID=1245769 RepID=A0A0C7N8Q6_9SACH|nr:uncharacterized protein LALA0_S06e07052g [Lachancea lanzarotensis]CEP62924.1 LALA0S06e07052g1_1 [Lachancea lanzarotensis]